MGYNINVSTELTEQQRKAVEQGGGAPIDLIDPVNQSRYVLLTAAAYSASALFWRGTTSTSVRRTLHSVMSQRKRDGRIRKCRFTITLSHVKNTHEGFEIKISCIIDKEQGAKALQIIHEACELEKVK